MTLNLLNNRIASGYTTFGTVWDKGEVIEPMFLLKGGNGEDIPVQSRITAYWPDKSIKWAAHTADSALMQNTVNIVPSNKSAAKTGTVLSKEDGNYYLVNTGKLKARIARSSFAAGIPGALIENINLIEDISLDNKALITKAYPVLLLERRRREGTSTFTEVSKHIGQVNSVTLEENGHLHCVFLIEGIHVPDDSEGCTMPFNIRLYFYHNSAEIRCVHTWFYDGKEERDFLKGTGLCFDTTLDGEAYNRHIQFGTDQGCCFHEAAVIMNSNNPRLPPSVLESQMSGVVQRYAKDSMEEAAANDLPIWNHYSLSQDSPSHYAIRKQTEENCCAIDCLHSRRALGVMAVNGSNKGIMLGIKDFWQKYPSGLEVSGLNDAVSKCTAWFYSPQTEAFDFRHYATRSYPKSSYEGFEYFGATAYGIAVTNECTISLLDSFPSGENIIQFAEHIQKPPVYIASPEYYHEKKAFGFWSLKKTDNEMELWLEKQLEIAVEFYIKEVENRTWYGLFNYGDIMHTYEKARHSWRYDVGGYAWQNTELVPTYWLWLYFLRTGREDVYTLAEAMSRHCSDVDFYHFGPMKGIGSRHNVRHWGCPCKEPRIAMAGHHRFYYYLTGDQRIGDAMDDSADADKSMVNIRYYTEGNNQKDKEVVLRSGPDWSSFVSNWMTKYERTLDESYRTKIETGINELNQTPFGLASGPYFVYESEGSHLVYREEKEASGMHLQICMGGPQVWFETAYMLDNEVLKKMLTDYGKFYFLSKEEKKEATGGLIEKRSFAYPYFAAGLGAYSANIKKDKDLADLVWKTLLDIIIDEHGERGFQLEPYSVDAFNKPMEEFTWVNRSGPSTNYLTQWCLNIIMTLDFIRDYLPTK